MHDPEHLALSVKRPWPSLSSFKRVGKRRRHLYWPSLVDVWHNEPGGRDAGDVCGYCPHKGLAKLAYLWRHRSHMHVIVIPARSLDRWLHLRCSYCNRKHRRYSPVNVSHDWGGDGPRYHSSCSAVVSLRRTLDEANEALRTAGVDSTLLVALGMDHTKAWRVNYSANREDRNAKQEQS